LVTHGRHRSCTVKHDILLVEEPVGVRRTQFLGHTWTLWIVYCKTCVLFLEEHVKVKRAQFLGDKWTS